jgi:hypothetical protein
MARGVKKPEDVFPELIQDLRDAFGGDLVAIVLHGSGARRDYLPGKSDLNFLIVLTDSGMAHLERALPFMRKWRRRSVATPHLVTKAFIAASLDVYPIEFLVMKGHYRLVWGEDVLATIAIDPSCLRVQMKRELQGKLLHLRRGYLETEGKPRRMAQLMAVSVTAFLAVFHAVLFVKGIPVPEEKRELVREAASVLACDPSVFLACLDVRGGAAMHAEQLHTVFHAYLEEAAKLAEAMENLPV